MNRCVGPERAGGPRFPTSVVTIRPSRSLTIPPILRSERTGLFVAELKSGCCFELDQQICVEADFVDSCRDHSKAIAGQRGCGEEGDKLHRFSLSDDSQFAFLHFSAALKQRRCIAGNHGGDYCFNGKFYHRDGGFTAGGRNFHFIWDCDAVFLQQGDCCFRFLITIGGANRIR